jgi:hypothetical protein
MPCGLGRQFIIENDPADITVLEAARQRLRLKLPDAQRAPHDGFAILHYLFD